MCKAKSGQAVTNAVHARKRLRCMVKMANTPKVAKSSFDIFNTVTKKLKCTVKEKTMYDVCCRH